MQELNILELLYIAKLKVYGGDNLYLIINTCLQEEHRFPSLKNVRKFLLEKSLTLFSPRDFYILKSFNSFKSTAK